MQMIATKAFRYAGRQLRVGDPINVGPTDARLLMALGRASVAVQTVSAKQAAKPVESKPLVIEPAVQIEEVAPLAEPFQDAGSDPVAPVAAVVDEEVTPEEAPKRRKYRRRDMSAGS